MCVESELNIDKFIFVCGLHRSGTTIIENYIHSVFDVSVLRADVPENEGQHLQDVYPPAKKFGGPGKFAFAQQMHPKEPTDSEASKCKNRLLECWMPHICGNETTLCEKSPPNLTKIKWLRKVFPNSMFIIVTRDPRAVASATIKWSKTSLESLVFHWHVAYSSAIESMSHDCVIIRYEDFCLNPFEVIENSGICSFVNKRKNTLDVDERFGIIINNNEYYISEHESMYYGCGAWDHFGYVL